MPALQMDSYFPRSIPYSEAHPHAPVESNPLEDSSCIVADLVDWLQELSQCKAGCHTLVVNLQADPLERAL